MQGVGMPVLFLDSYMKNHTAISTVPNARVARMSSCRFCTCARFTQEKMAKMRELRR